MNCGLVNYVMNGMYMLGVLYMVCNNWDNIVVVVLSAAARGTSTTFAATFAATFVMFVMFVVV